MVDACFLGLAIGFGQKSRFDPTVFIKYTVADTVLFEVIAGVISAFEKENIIVFLNSVIMDIVIGGMLFLLCLTRDYRIQFYQPDYAKSKIVVLIVLFLMPILRVFGFGREIFLYLLKPGFFWGISGGLIFTVAVLFLLKPQDLNLEDEIVDWSFLSFSTVFEWGTVGTVVLTCHFTRDRSLEYLVVALLAVLVIQALFEAKLDNKGTKTVKIVFYLLAAAGLLTVFLINREKQQTFPFWAVIIGELPVLVGFFFPLCQEKLKLLKRNGRA
jgi:hypothetical protein